MQFINLKAQYNALKPQIDQKIQQVMDHGFYIKGPEIAEFEAQVADYVGVKHAIACSSGTVALQMALMALEIGPGDEVITTPFSFFATVEMILLLGATPVYVDIDPKTYNLDPALLNAAITDKTRAILPVGLYGQCADMQAINAIANTHSIAVIEDACQSFGATHHGVRSCNLSTLACTSYFPSKPLGTYGDGGMCFTNDDALAHRLHLIMNHGESSRYHHEILGINGRLDTMKAAILQVKLTALDKELKMRDQVIAWYRQYLPAPYCMPFIADFNTSSYAQMTIQVADRDAMQAHLKEAGVPTAVHYPVLMYQQPVILKNDSRTWVCPEAEKAANHVLSLPFGPYMTEAEVQAVASALAKVVC
jgi:UDP-2-acetamido-2-deoxy-ribo-hexuluronate aminotransferase